MTSSKLQHKFKFKNLIKIFINSDHANIIAPKILRDIADFYGLIYVPNFCSIDPPT